MSTGALAVARSTSPVNRAPTGSQFCNARFVGAIPLPANGGGLGRTYATAAPRNRRGEARVAKSRSFREERAMTATPNKLLVSSGATSAGARGEQSQRLPLFARLSNEVARLTGKPVTFALCCLIILAWAATGPVFHYSDTWQLIINTGTTIVTFLMVFLIQNTQN